MRKVWRFDRFTNCSSNKDKGDQLQIDLRVSVYCSRFPTILQSVEQDDPCKKEWKNTTEIYVSHAPRVPPSQDTLTGHKPLSKEVKFIDRDNHWYTRKVKEAIHIRLNPNNINRATEPKYRKRGCRQSKKHENQRCAASQRTPKENTVQRNNSRIETRQSQQTTAIHNAVPHPVDPIAWRRLAVSSRNVAIII